MTPAVNLHILAKRFAHLSEAEFFDPAFKEFLAQTINAIEHVLESQTSYPETVIRQFEAKLWGVRQFLIGSKTTDAPHETQFVLTKVLKKWIDKEALISSASLEQFDFFLDPEDMWDFIKKSLTEFETEDYGPLLVRIGSPEPYKHRPVFCTPLFHELGHFIDFQFKISEYTLLTNPIGKEPNGFSAKDWYHLNLSHRREYFADLFSACYVGKAGLDTLNIIAPNNPDSFTHPATIKRVKLIADFIDNKPNPIIGLFQDALIQRKIAPLKSQYKTPNIVDSFDDALTYQIQDEHELYGIYEASTTYLHDQLTNRTAKWIDDTATDYTIEKTINDLTEKSIRNFEIKERWQNVTND